MSEEEKREEIIKEARSWLNPPTAYHHQARLKGVGVDCAQFLIDIYFKCGLIPDLKITDYSMQWALHHNDEKYLGWVKKYAVEISEAEVKPGDIALFKFGRVIGHGAIVVKWPIVIHAFNKVGVCYADATQFPLGNKDRLKGFFSLWGSSEATPVG